MEILESEMKIMRIEALPDSQIVRDGKCYYFGVCYTLADKSKHFSLSSHFSFADAKAEFQKLPYAPRQLYALFDRSGQFYGTSYLYE